VTKERRRMSSSPFRQRRPIPPPHRVPDEAIRNRVLVDNPVLLPTQRLTLPLRSCHRALKRSKAFSGAKDRVRNLPGRGATEFKCAANRKSDIDVGKIRNMCYKLRAAGINPSNGVGAKRIAAENMEYEMRKEDFLFESTVTH
jgi:hypothetical protein